MASNVDRTCGGKMPYAPPLTFDEAMAWTGTTRNVLYSMAKKGLVGRKVGRKWYFSQAELLRTFKGEGPLGSDKGSAE